MANPVIEYIDIDDDDMVKEFNNCIHMSDKWEDLLL